MAERAYIACDGCGLHDTDGRNDTWRRSREGWAEVHVYDEEEGGMVIKDYCPECWSKAVRAVE